MSWYIERTLHNDRKEIEVDTSKIKVELSERVINENSIEIQNEIKKAVIGFLNRHFYKHSFPIVLSVKPKEVYHTYDTMANYHNANYVFRVKNDRHENNIFLVTHRV